MRLARLNGREQTTPIPNPPIKFVAMYEMAFIPFG